MVSRIRVEQPTDHALVLSAVLCASRLKNSTLRLDNAMVTLIPSSRNTSWSGEGRKSRTTLSSPSGSSVYLILALIDLLAPPPVTGADDSNGIRAGPETNRHDAFTDRTAERPQKRTVHARTRRHASIGFAGLSPGPIRSIPRPSRRWDQGNARRAIRTYGCGRTSARPLLYLSPR